MDKNIAKHIFFFPIQYIRGQGMGKDLKRAKEIEVLATSQIIELRNEKLRSIVKYSYQNIPFYKERFDKSCVKLEIIKRQEDLHQLPVLSKREIMENENAMINQSVQQKLFTRKTGGSTGMTLHFMKEGKTLALNDAIMYRCYAWYGLDIGDRQARFWGVPVTRKLRWKEQIKDAVLNRIRISAFDISKESCLKQYERIKKFKPAYFYGYTTAIYGFCLFMKELGINLDDLNLKAVICTAEKMYPHHRKLFGEVFRCPVVDEYGSSENGIIAFQCRKGNMHMMADHMCIEFLDDHDRPVKPGEQGRIVITDLSSYAMPLIRYDIGDIGRPSNNICTCGVNLPLMEIMEGRKEDFIRCPDGKVVHAAYLCYTLKDDTVHEFKMYQKGLYQLHVQIVKAPSFSANSEQVLEKKLRTALDEKVQISFEYLDRIPREQSGKLRYFVSELKEAL
jgi:phenylacetate-CoA ligase